jgi:hypothetical protein
MRWAMEEVRVLETPWDSAGMLLSEQEVEVEL